MNHRTLVSSAVAGLLVGALAACGGSDDESGTNNTIVVGTTDRVVSSQQSPYPFDPVASYDGGSWNILRQTVQTLMIVPRGAGEPVPEAASECGFADRQNEQFRCKLRSGLTFSDGTPLTVKDVVYSIDRVLDMKYAQGAYGLLANIDKVETGADNEVIFHLKTPDATFPYKLATPVAGIVSAKHYGTAKPREGFAVDGSGPYTLKATTRNGELVSALFTKNPNYKGSVKVANTKVELRTYTDADDMGKALEDAGIDVASRTLTPAQVTAFGDNKDRSVTLYELPGLEIHYLGFNTDDPVVGNKAVRQAIAQLVDRDALIAAVYGDTAEPLYSLVPTGINGHLNSFVNTYGNPSVPAAAALLSDAKITTPVELTLHYTTDHYGEATKKEFEALQQQLNDSGLFQVATEGTEWAKFRPAQADRQYAVYGMGWFPDFPDADNYLAPFLDEGSFLNSPYVNNDIRTGLIPQTRRETDRDLAVVGFGRIQDIVAADVPVLPLWQGKQYLAARQNISGVEWAINSSSDLQLWELTKHSG